MAIVAAVPPNSRVGTREIRVTASDTSQPKTFKHVAVYEAIRGRLEQGEFAIGDQLPTEDELCETYRVGRYTVREALKQLARQGFIETRRRAGTRVIAHFPKEVFRHAAASRSDIFEFVRGTVIQFGPPELIQTDGRLARFLGCDELRQWYVIEGVRFEPSDQRPLGLTRVYVDAARAAIPPDLELGHRPVYEWLEEKFGIRARRISQEISAVMLGESEATALSERPGLPALKIVRRYFDEQQRLFQIAVTTHRSEDMVYSTQFDLG
jgi:GntR family transcriptional regulator